jgi:hypothetical protein
VTLAKIVTGEDIVEENPKESRFFFSYLMFYKIILLFKRINMNYYLGSRVAYNCIYCYFFFNF